MAAIPMAPAAASTAIQWAPIAVNAIGSALSALGGSSANKKNAKEAKAQRETQERMGYSGMEQEDRQYGFNANMGRSAMLDSRSMAAADMQGRLNRSPLADQAQFLIQQRLGLGNVVNGMGDAAARYRPGMGGVDTSAMRASLARLSDASSVPGEYQAQSGQQMRLTAYRDQLMQSFANERDPARRDRFAKQIAEVDRVMQAGAQGGSGIDEYDRNLWVPPKNEQQRMVDEMIRARAGLGGFR